MTTPRGDGVINVAVPYVNGGQVTSTNLNDIVDDAEFNTNAVDDSSVAINGSGQLIVKDNGISTAKIVDDNVNAAKVSFVDDSLAATSGHVLIGDGTDFHNKAVSGDVAIDSNGAVTIQSSAVEKSMIENIADDRVLGNISGGAAAPSELTAAIVVTMLGTSLINPTSIDASTESITFSNGLIVKFGSETQSGGGTVTFGSAFPNSIYTVIISPRRSDGSTGMTQGIITAQSTSAFTANFGTASSHTNWVAIGR